MASNRDSKLPAEAAEATKTAQRPMDNAQASFWLSQFIGQNLRILTSDNRVFGGQMKCTDKDRNIILTLCYEYRQPPAEVIRQVVEATGNPSAPVNWSSRYVGLVVVPGGHIKKIEFEEPTFGKSGVVI